MREDEGFGYLKKEDELKKMQRNEFTDGMVWFVYIYIYARGAVNVDS